MNLNNFEEGLIDQIQAERCKKLLWSVINLAVQDACLAPYASKPSTDSITAMRFLVGNEKEAGVDGYLMWLDVDGPEFRRRLVEAMFAERHDKFPDIARRAFRANFNWWRKNRANYIDDGE